MSEPLKGHLDTMLLAALRDGPAHGYAIVRMLEQRSEGIFAVGEGTVYPALRRLEKSGLLRSGASVVDGRKRRVYRLSPAGQAVLDERTHEWSRFAHGMGALLHGEGAV